MTETGDRGTTETARGRTPIDPSLCDGLAAWIEVEAGGRIERAVRAGDGASRQAFAVDVRSAAGEWLELFCLRDATSGSGGSQRDAAVLRALAGTAVPVPRVVASSPVHSAVLLERVGGRSDYPNVDDEAEREPTAGDLMRVASALHALDPDRLAIEHLGPPPDPARAVLDEAARQRATLDALLASLGGDAHPAQRLAASWLAQSPPRARRISLVHSDFGPGNFLAAKGRITAVLDWEVAHWGDPMEDLAALAVRDMATPVGPLVRRYAEYRAAGGAEADLAAIAWYRIFILARNTALIALGLRRPLDPVVREPLERFSLLLRRALAFCLCDVSGAPRPGEAGPVESEDGTASSLRASAARLARELDAEVRMRAEWMGPLADRLPQRLGEEGLAEEGLVEA